MKRKGPESPACMAAVFDCDGVLVDTEPLHYRAFQEILVPLGLGHDYARYMEEFIGFDDRDAFLHAFREAGRDLDAAELERLIEAKAGALARQVERGISTFPGVIELIRELQEWKIPMAVASGALRHEVLAFIKSLGLDGAFCVVVAANDVKKSKPDPESYIKAVAMLRNVENRPGLAPANCVAFEDTPAGIESARAAGLFVVGVTNSFSESDLGGADIVVESLAALDCSKLSKLIESRSKSR